MNFPSVDYTWFGNGTVIALIAIIHVIISHGVAIGTSVLIVSTEYRAMKRKNEALDQVAKTMLKWVLIITTTMGAMTGVGIWFSTTVIQPDSISSLLRIFFWAWVVEWGAFISEVIILIVYYYTWDKWKEGERKRKHIMLGVALSIASWVTMVIITGVLAAKLTPGRWIDTFSFWNAFLNPTYFPSLGFRMFLAIMLAISLVSFFIRWRIKDKALRTEVFRVFAFWGAIALPLTFITGLWYLWAIPTEAYNMIVWSTGMSEVIFKSLNILGFSILLIFLVWLVKSPKNVPWMLSIAVMFSSIGFIGEFEVVRESVRKPYIIYNYMYANGMLAKDEETLKKEGYLANATWAKEKEVTNNNMVEAGRDVFVGQCITCHTIDGWRDTRALATRMKGWDKQAIMSFIPNMHYAQVAMPPFMGTEEEIEALATYIVTELENDKEVTPK